MAEPTLPDTHWFEVDDSPEAVLELLAEHGWGDGLPVVPATAPRVDAMLAAAGGAPDEVLAVLPPRMGALTRRVLAINAVLAGCPSDLMPVLVAVARALAEPRLNLPGVQATTHPTAPFVIVHGAAVDALGFNAGSGTFGPGWRANATLGRCVRFLLMHVGGARPGSGDASTQGQPSKYAYCFAEHTAASPWPTYPRACGVDAASAVTVGFGENPHNSHDMWSSEPSGILDAMASVIAQLGGNNAPISTAEVFVVLCPEHAATIAGAGWARRDVQSYLFERARLPGRLLRRYDPPAWSPWVHAMRDDDLVPVTDHPDNYRVLVAGGAGKHSCVIPSWGVTRSVTLPVDIADPFPEVASEK